MADLLVFVLGPLGLPSTEGRGKRGEGRGRGRGGRERERRGEREEERREGEKWDRGRMTKREMRGNYVYTHSNIILEASS